MIGATRKAEMLITQSLKNSESRYRCLFETAQEGILILDAGTGMIEDANPYLSKMLGYSREELVGKKLREVGAFRDIEASRYAFDALHENEAIRYEDLPLKAKDGRLIQVEFVSNVYLVGDEKLVQCNIRDITERKRAEEALHKSERRFRTLVNNSPDVIYVLDLVERRPIFFNRQGLLGYSRQELQVSDSVLLAAHPDDQNEFSTHWQMLLGGDLAEARRGVEYRLKHKDGIWEWFQSRETVLARDQNDQPTQVMVTLTPIAEQRRAKEKMRLRVSELEVLYESSMAFSQLKSPKAIAQKMLDLLDQKKDWHHTVIRMYHPENETLELLAFNLPQFNSPEERRAAEELFKTVQHPSQGLSGWVIQHGQALRSNDLKKDPRYYETFPGLCSGLYVPIKIAERVIGVITIESDRSKAFSLLDERLVITLARQAAIAMDDAQLLENLKRSNIELTSAYDAAIEGWARALDLRNKEGEGHSQRVTDMTLRLAQNMGVSEEELAYIRRGALLHDIGKIGVPDEILLKPAPLTAEEWMVIKKHPIFAYEMLSPIQYLQEALDIPYCHHEKWDGSGYPRRLKGTQIPLAARIFAVADVWDERSSRAEEAREYICSSSGTHFDPQVVDVFMQMLH